MLNLELRATAMPRSVAKRKITAAQRRRRAAQTAARIWAPEVLNAHRTELLSALDGVTEDPSYLSYTTARFVVTQWEGVTITGSGATVTLLGRERFHAPGEGWTTGQRSQLQIQLVRYRHHGHNAQGNGHGQHQGQHKGASGWRMLEKKVLFDEAEGN